MYSTFKGSLAMSEPIIVPPQGALIGLNNIAVAIEYLEKLQRSLIDDCKEVGFS